MPERVGRRKGKFSSAGARICCLALIFLVSLSSAIVKVNKETLQYVDEYGRTRIFHGVNAVYKIPPWHPELESFNTYSSLAEQDMKDLKAWGFNAIRLGVMWPGVAPQKDIYNSTYLNLMDDLITRLGSHGIYTIVDFHQDLFSRYFCGEGVPDWATPLDALLEFPLPIRSPDSLYIDPNTGYPNVTSCEEISFYKYYYTGAVGNAFQQLYDNENGLQDQFIKYWEQIAAAFRSNEFVLGYELINEPWCGNIFEYPAVYSPDYADIHFLDPMYKAINRAIRKIDDEHIIFYEAAVNDVYDNSGFTEGPGGPLYNDRQAYSYHIYCVPSDDNGDPTKPVFCNVTLSITFDVKQEDRVDQGVAGFMTEFGALEGTEGGLESLNYLLALADENIQSWCYWQYKFNADITTSAPDGAESFYINGELDEAKVKTLSRTYAPIIAGTPLTYRFDPITADFAFAFTVDMTLPNLTTTVFANREFYYPTGLNIRASSNLVVTESPDNYVFFESISSGIGSIHISQV